MSDLKGFIINTILSKRDIGSNKILIEWKAQLKGSKLICDRCLDKGILEKLKMRRHCSRCKQYLCRYCMYSDTNYLLFDNVCNY